MNEIKKIYGGLLPTNPEKTAFSFGAIFSYPDPKTLPTDYLVGQPLEIKNQGNSFICVAESLMAVSEQQEGVILDPSFTIKTISELTGDKNWIWVGTSLDIGLKAALRGALEASESPYTIEKDGLGIIADPKNWSDSYNEIGQKHAKQAGFWIGVSGKLDFFDAIRGAMWIFKNEKRAVQIGIVWNSGWESQTYISEKTEPSGGHALCVLGWKNDYLVIQNSIGKEIGENGIQYIHRNIINENKQFKGLMYADMPEGMTKEDILKKSQWYRSSFTSKLLLLLKKWFQDIFK